MEKQEISIEKQGIMPKPQKKYYNNCKIVNYISTHTGMIDVPSLELKTIPRKNICVVVDLTSADNLQMSSADITPYDLAVMDAAYTILKNGCDSFTPELLVRVMAGDMKLNVTLQKKIAVISSMEKLRHINISINCTDEYIARKYITKDDESVILTSSLMPVENVSIIPAFHKSEVEGYHLIKVPVLYTYAETVKQIIDIPTDLLVLNNINMTDDIIVLRDYLIKRIAAMKNTKNHMSSNRITYEWHEKNNQKANGLLPYLGYDKAYQEDHKNNWRRKKSEIHKSVMAILDNFKAKKYIKGYAPVTKSKAVCGIDIEL